MNYRHIYMLIIEHAKSEEKLGLRKKGNGEYYESHHILPKSMFPLWAKEKRNLVLLTSREHLFVHKLLFKIYKNSQMACALMCMQRVKRCSDVNDARAIMSDIGRKNFKKLWDDPDFRKRKIEATIKYNKTRQYHHSEETKRKIGKASSKLVHTEETKRRIGESNSKQIICVETGEIFKSAKDCAKHFNVKTQNIYCVTNGKHKYTNINGKRLSFKLI